MEECFMWRKMVATVSHELKQLSSVELSIVPWQHWNNLKELMHLDLKRAGKQFWGKNYIYDKAICSITITVVFI